MVKENTFFPGFFHYLVSEKLIRERGFSVKLPISDPLFLEESYLRTFSIEFLMVARKEDSTYTLTNPIFNNPYYQEILPYPFCYSLTFFSFPFLPRPGLSVD